MLTLGTQTTDYMLRFEGSAHTRADMSQGERNTQAREANAKDGRAIGGGAVDGNAGDGELSRRDKDVLHHHKLQRIHRVLNVELSVNLSASFHRTQESNSLPSYSEPQFDADEVVNNVMSFIKGRIDEELAAGKNKQELEKLIEQAEAGVMKGIGEATGALKSMGMFDDDVTQGIADIQEGLAHGVHDLYGYILEGQAEEEPTTVDSSQSQEVSPTSPSVDYKQGVSQEVSSESRQVNYSHTQSSDITAMFERFQPTIMSDGVTSVERSGATSFTVDETFNFEVKTKDGDIIRLNIDRGLSHLSSFGTTRTGGGFGAAYSEQSSSYANISYSVEGELDEGELDALDALFAKVNKLADSFFAGDIGQAFNQAISLNYDSTELAGFSLNLMQTQTMAEVYKEVAHMTEPVRGEGNNRPDLFQSVGPFVRDIVESFQDLEAHSPFDHVAELVSTLLGKAVAEISDHDADKNQHTDLNSYIRNFLNEIGQQYHLMS